MMSIYLQLGKSLVRGNPLDVERSENILFCIDSRHVCAYQYDNAHQSTLSGGGECDSRRTLIQFDSIQPPRDTLGKVALIQRISLMPRLQAQRSIEDVVPREVDEHSRELIEGNAENINATDHSTGQSDQAIEFEI